MGVHKLQDNMVSIVRSGRKYNNHRNIFSNNPFFKKGDYVTIEEDDYCLIITKHGLDTPHNAKVITSEGRIHHITNIKPGRYEIDEEESTEDQLIIYYND